MGSKIRYALLAAFVGAGCAHKPRLPRVQSLQATTRPAVVEPAPKPIALLTLDEIEPRPVLAAPGSQPSASGADRPPLKAIELYARAHDALQTSRRHAAIELLQKAIALDSHSPELHYALGRTYLGDSAYDDRSIVAMAKAAVLRPDQLALQTDLGRQHLAKGDPAGLRHLRLALQTHDYATDAVGAAVADLFLARGLQQNGYDTAALQLYDRLLARVQPPTQALRSRSELAYLLGHIDLLRLQKAELHEKLGQLDQALAVYASAADRDPGNFALRSRVVRVLARLGRYQQAAARAADAVAEFRASDESVALLREAYRLTGRESALPDELSRLHRERPNDRGILFALSDMLRALDRPGEAFKMLADAAAEAPDDSAILRRLCQLASEADPNGDGAAAARLLVQWSAQHPDSVHAMPGLWADLLRPRGRHRLTFRAVQGLDGNEEQKHPRWEAAKLFWVSQLARLQHRDDLARGALEAAAGSEAIFAPAYRALMDRIGSAADKSAEQKARESESLAARAAEAGDAALAAEVRGLALLSRRNYAAAEKKLAEAVQLGGAAPDLCLAYAVAARGAGNAGRFEKTLWKLVSDWPAYEDAYEALFNYYQADGTENQAGRVLTIWLGANPDSIPARLLQARDSYRWGRVQAAEAILLKLFDESGDDSRVLAGLGSFYWQTGKSDEFLAKLEQFHARTPAYLTAAARLIELYVERGRIADATRALDKTRAAATGDPGLLYGVAHLYTRVGQQQSTDQVLRQVLELDPAHAPAGNDLGYSLADAGRDLAEAESLTRRAVDADPGNASFLDSLGWVLYKRGRFDEARACFDRALGAAPEPDPVMLDHLGDVMYRQGDRAGAAEQWKRAAEGAAAGEDDRDDLKRLRLHLDRKAQQFKSGRPVDVAPAAEGSDAQGPKARAPNSAPSYTHSP